MQFVRIGEYLAVSRITGPSHNLLQVRLRSESGEAPMCECLPSQESGARLDAELLVANVLAGIAEANEKFGVHYGVTHIRYIATDSKPESVYRQLAFKIIEQLETGAEYQ